MDSITTLADTEAALGQLSVSRVDSCSICLGGVRQFTELNSCTHSFCLECISAWSKQRRNCPLCNNEFTIIKYRNESGSIVEQEVPEPAVRQTDLASDLECLDQTYFFSEANRLLSLAQDAQRTMVRLQKQNVHSKFGSKFRDSWEARKWDLLQVIESRLQLQIELFRSDERIEPLSVLQELYDIQAQMEMVWKVPSKDQVVEQSAPLRYSADNCDDLSSDSEDEHEYEYEGPKGKSKKKAPKRPSSTKGRK